MVYDTTILAVCCTALLLTACSDDGSGDGSTGGPATGGITASGTGMPETTGPAGSETGTASATTITADSSSSGAPATSSSSSGDGPSDESGGPATCGNNVLEAGETCDLVQLDGQTCESLGYEGGVLACNVTCDDFNLLGCFICGNDVIDAGEDCEGVVPDGTTCATMGFDDGQLACGADCLWDTSDCALCGDGVAQSTESCDGMDLAGEDCASLGLIGGTLGCTPGCVYDTNACDVTNRIIFVSSVTYNGDLGGLLGADAECQALADAAGLPGIYMAWLSTAMESPSTRMTQSALPYVRPDGVQVAPNWAGLIDGTLDAPINVTETGGAVPIGNTSCAGGGFPTVWSATSSTGATAGGSNCSDWTSIAGGSQWGRADVTDGSWTSWCSGGLCDWLSPIYCVQQ